MGNVHLSPEKLALAIDLQRKFKSQAEIAATLGVQRESVCRALARHNRRTLKRLEKQAAAEKAKQFDQLQGLASSLWRAWERSLQDAETVRTIDEPVDTVQDGSVSRTTKTETTIKGQSGDAALVNQLRGCLADMRKILGLDAPPLKAREEEKPDDDYEIDLSPHPEAEADPPQPGDGPAA